MSNRMIPVAVCNLSGNEKKYVDDCLDSSWISSNGKYVSMLEAKLAETFQTKHAIVTCNGTVSLHLALIALGLKGGDEVIVPDVTYIATANVVRYCDAVPIFVDCNPKTWNIRVEDIEARITPKTKGIIPVHLYGHPCDMDPIMELAQKYGLFVLEDAAEAHGALYKGRPVGSIGDCGSFSLFGNKIITTGEGGFLTTNNDQLAEHMRILRSQGMSPTQRYWFSEVGYNYRMTNVAAAIGLGQVEQFEQHLERRQRIAREYTKRFTSISPDLLLLPYTESWAHHVYWMYTVRLGDAVKKSRDEIMGAMLEAGIETRPVFHPMHTMPPYKEDGMSYPNSQAALRGINLPTHELLTDDDLDHVTATLIRLLSNS